MMTNPMTCDVFTDRLMAYLEHETDDATRAAMERHAAGCGECGPLLADLRKLRADTASLPALTPSHDLWAAIASRIEAPVVSIGTGRERGQQSALVRRVTRGALVAAALVAAAGLGYAAATSRQTTNPTIAPTVAVVNTDTSPGTALSPALPAAAPQQLSTERRAPSPVGRTPVLAPAPTSRFASAVSAESPTVRNAVASLSADYDREIARLRVLIEQRRNQLDPVTVAIIERNLQMIDGAIAECKKAILRDPASRFLIESLNQSLQTKVELMRTAALLPTRT